MIRAVVLSIVLILAAGQNAALLCRGWCHPTEPIDVGCHHPYRTASPTVISNEICKGAVAVALPFVPEDVLRPRLSAQAQTDLFSPRFGALPPILDGRSGFKPAGPSPREARPLALSLRI